MGLLAQIGIGTTSPHPSAMLHISAGAGNNKGLLMPKVTSAQRVVLDSTQNISNGLVLFDTDLQKFYYFGQGPRIWKELDSDWIRKDVAGAGPVVGTHIYTGVSGNVGVGTASNVNPGSKLTVVGNMSVGSATYTQDSVAPANGVTLGTWLGIGTRTRTSGYVLDVKGPSHFRTGDVLVDNDVRANRFYGEGVVPQYGIIMYSGAVSGNFSSTGSGVLGTQYEGWALCNGLNGTPDLRGRFIVGMSNNDGNDYGYPNSEKNLAAYLAIDGTGGQRKDTITVAEMPSHTHAAQTTSTGTHAHSMWFDDGGGGTGPNSNVTVSSVSCSGCGGNGTGSTTTGGGHNHNINVDPEGQDTPTENRPPYYVLAYIMKL